MRVVFCVVLLGDLTIRSTCIDAFLTDDGVLPLEILKNYNWNPVYFSFHALSGSYEWQVVLFIINALCILLLLIGYRPQMMTFICWVFLTSLQNRNPFILQGGDDLLRITLFWMLFLPWGKRYTLFKSTNETNQHLSAANAGYLLLIFSVYFFSALLKTSPEWHSQGTALYYALSLDQIKLPLGDFLYQYPGVLKLLTHLVYYLELLIPFLLILPLPSYKFRLTGIICIALLHAGIGLTLYVGLFYIIGLTTLIGILPRQSMDFIEQRLWKFKRAVNHHDESTNRTIGRVEEIITTAKNCFLILVIAFCLTLNLCNVKWFPFLLEQQVINFGKALRIDQNWGMFSPSILKDDGWQVISGYTRHNTYIDIMQNGSAISYRKPKSIVATYPNDRWRKFSENYVFNNNNYMRPYYCRYLLKKWNKAHPDNPVSEVTVFFMKEKSLPDYQTKPIEKLALCNCHEKD